MSTAQIFMDARGELHCEACVGERIIMCSVMASPSEQAQGKRGEERENLAISAIRCAHNVAVHPDTRV